MAAPASLKAWFTLQYFGVLFALSNDSEGMTASFAHCEKEASGSYKIKHQMNCVSQACVEKRQGAKPTAYNDVLSFWQQLDRQFDTVLKQRPDEALNSHHVLFGVWISFTGLWKRLWNIKKNIKNWWQSIFWARIKRLADIENSMTSHEVNQYICALFHRYDNCWFRKFRKKIFF